MKTLLKLPTYYTTYVCTGVFYIILMQMKFFFFLNEKKNDDDDERIRSHTCIYIKKRWFSLSLSIYTFRLFFSIPLSFWMVIKWKNYNLHYLSKKQTITIIDNKKKNLVTRKKNSGRLPLFLSHTHTHRHKTVNCFSSLKTSLVFISSCCISSFEFHNQQQSLLFLLLLLLFCFLVRLFASQHYCSFHSIYSVFFFITRKILKDSQYVVQQ